MAALKHVLCIDDEEDILAVARMALETVGSLTVTTCSNGNDGLAQVARAQPDLILLDVMMPQMDGPSTLKMLRRNPASNTVPIVFMTARVQPAEIKRYLELGATAVIPKPFDPMTLFTQITDIWRTFHAK
jgi:two-component system, OmpR family, response regulator